MRRVRAYIQPDLQAMERAFHGVRIGASSKSLHKLKLKQINRSGSGPIKVTKWMLPNGNDLSVTYNSETDRIVYMEVDWCRKKSASSTGLAKKQFGTTSLGDIRKAFKSNGFTYTNKAFLVTPTEFVTFNAFELHNTPNIIAVFITSISQEDQNKIRALQSEKEMSDEVSNAFKLVAIVLADEAYLDQIWGAKKVYDPVSRPIKLPVANKVWNHS